MLSIPLTDWLPSPNQRWRDIVPLLKELFRLFTSFMLLIYALCLKLPYQILRVALYKLGILIDAFPRLAVGVTVFIMGIPMMFLFVQLRHTQNHENYALYRKDTIIEKSNDSCYHAGYRKCLEDIEHKKKQDQYPIKPIRVVRETKDVRDTSVKPKPVKAVSKEKNDVELKDTTK